MKEKAGKLTPKKNKEKWSGIGIHSGYGGSDDKVQAALWKKWKK